MSPNKEALVSVIIPCYNQAIYLSEAIDSALAQDYLNIEIIVVDDGSLDNTAKVARRYGKKVKLFQQENKGLSAARNAGIREASGKYIVCLDADDRLSPAFCKLTAPILEKKPKVGLVATGWRFFGKSNYAVIPRAASFAEHLAMNMITCSALFKKSDWERIGGFDETMLNGFEDWDFWIRLRKSGCELEVVPQILFEYRKRGPSMGTAAHRQSADILAFLHKKHADLYSEHFAEIHIILFDIFRNKRTLFQKPEQRNSWKISIMEWLKHLAYALLPNSLIAFLKEILIH